MCGAQRAGVERAGAREVGRTRDVGFQIGVRRTVPHPPATVWSALTSDVGLAAWLGSEVRDAADRTAAAAELLEAGARFTTADAAEREERREHWRAVADTLAAIVEAHATS